VLLDLQRLLDGQVVKVELVGGAFVLDDQQGAFPSGEKS
jgi:hypothetical protein